MVKPSDHRNQDQCPVVAQAAEFCARGICTVVAMYLSIVSGE